MVTFSRGIKQIIVLIIFLILVGGLSFGVYKVAVPPTPTPTPNPTINLIPLQIISTKLLNVQNNDYDFLAKITNRNLDYGSGNVQYELKFYDSSNVQFTSKIGIFYILPGQTRYVVDSPLSFDRPIGKVDVQIKSVDWQKVNSLATNGTKLVAKNTNFTLSSQQGTYAKAGGSIVNASNFDFDSVDVIVVAIDASGEVVAVSKTNIRTFLAQTERGFEVSWFTPFIGNVDHADAEADTNVFNNLNFLRQFGGSQKFQQFY